MRVLWWCADWQAGLSRPALPDAYEHLPPHVFAMADWAYRRMVETRRQRSQLTTPQRQALELGGTPKHVAAGLAAAVVNQSLLVSGESGAGKTEATKIILRYVTHIAGGSGVGSGVGSGSGGVGTGSGGGSGSSAVVGSPSSSSPSSSTLSPPSLPPSRLSAAATSLGSGGGVGAGSSHGAPPMPPGHRSSVVIGMHGIAGSGSAAGGAATSGGPAVRTVLSPRRSGQSSISQQVLESNPILEAFGNAKTLRNENSSRFGKFILLQFDDGGMLCGAVIRTYVPLVTEGGDCSLPSLQMQLCPPVGECDPCVHHVCICTNAALLSHRYLLEKVRLIKQSDGERSFHIFYQLVNGLSWAEKKELALLTVPDYHYLARSGCFDRRDGDDGAMLQDTKHAMEVGTPARLCIETVAAFYVPAYACVRVCVCVCV